SRRQRPSVESTAVSEVIRDPTSQKRAGVHPIGDEPVRDLAASANRADRVRWNTGREPGLPLAHEIDDVRYHNVGRRVLGHVPSLVDRIRLAALQKSLRRVEIRERESPILASPEEQDGLPIAAKARKPSEKSPIGMLRIVDRIAAFVPLKRSCSANC